MISLIVILLNIIIIVYLTFAICLFLNFVINNYVVTVTDNTTNEKYTPKGFKRLKYLLFMSFFWPVTIHFK